MVTIPSRWLRRSTLWETPSDRLRELIRLWIKLKQLGSRLVYPLTTSMLSVHSRRFPLHLWEQQPQGVRVGTNSNVRQAVVFLAMEQTAWVGLLKLTNPLPQKVPHLLVAILSPSPPYRGITSPRALILIQSLHLPLSFLPRWSPLIVTWTGQWTQLEHPPISRCK